ncbi:transposase-like protein [Bradyrhizobium sp. USDA 3397]
MKSRVRFLLAVALGAIVGGLAVFFVRLPIAEIAEFIKGNPAAAVAAVAAVFAFIAGVLGPLVQWRIGRRQAIASQTSAEASMLTARTAGAREIAKLRMSWMEELRQSLCEYHAILMSTEDGEELKAEDVRTLSRPPGHTAGLAAQSQGSTAATFVGNSRQTLQARLPVRKARLRRALVEAGRDVLKEEWEKVKREMRGDEFQTGEYGNS